MPGIESECQTERSKTIARWFGIVILTLLMSWQRKHGMAAGLTTEAFYGIVGGVVFINLAHSLYLFRAKECPRAYKYVSVGLDVLFLSATIRFTGFNQSPFFFVYFVLLISNCIRYGLLMSLFIAAAVNVCYAIVLSMAPELPPTVLGGEGLKVIAFWAVAFYGGSVSARIRRQAFELSTYEETIAELRSKLEEKQNIEAAPDG